MTTDPRSPEGSFLGIRPFVWPTVALLLLLNVFFLNVFVWGGAMGWW